MNDVIRTSKECSLLWPHDWSYHGGICATCRRCGAQEVDGQGAPQHCSAAMIVEIERLQSVIAGMIQGLKDADAEARSTSETSEQRGVPVEESLYRAVSHLLSHWDEHNKCFELCGTVISELREAFARSAAPGQPEPPEPPEPAPPKHQPCGYCGFDRLNHRNNYLGHEWRAPAQKANQPCRT